MPPSEPPAVEAALTDALQRKLTTLGRVRRCLERSGGRGRRGAGVLRSIVESLDEAHPESRLELRLLRALRRSHLPVPVSQFTVRRGGRVIARVDFAYPDIRPAIEAEGYRYHGGPGSWKRDLARRNALSALGWTVLHVTWDDLDTRPHQVVEQVRDAVRRLSLMLPDRSV